MVTECMGLKRSTTYPEAAQAPTFEPSTRMILMTQVALGDN